MKAFLVHGSSDKARYDYAQNVAHENSWNFISLDSKEYKNFSKHFISSTLDSTRTVFFLNYADKLSYENSIDFLQLIKDSPHIIILSAEVLPNVNFILKKSCSQISLGLKLSRLMSCLKTLMTEEDRDLVRLAIKEEDPLFLFHVLKKSAWKAPEVIPSLMRINRNIYKNKPAFILSLLAFAFPKRMFAIGAGKKKNDESKMRKKILKKIAKAFHLSSSKVADLYLLFRRLGSVPERVIALSDEEKKFLGISAFSSMLPEKQTLKAPTSSLSEFF